MKNAKSLGAVNIYIYIVMFNEINLCEHRETMYFKRMQNLFKVYGLFLL